MDNDVRWCRFLNNPENKYSLLRTTDIKDGNIIVCQQLKYRQFAKFENHVELMKYQAKTDPFDNCFYEIMTENMKRKPYFDIDIKRYNNSEAEHEDSKNMVNQIKDKILEVIKGSGADVEKAQILVYTSHTGKKLSYHIIVHGFYLKDHRECKNFFEAVSDKCDYSYQGYIDCSVYKTVQQLRILGSHKYFSRNTKVLSKSMSHNFSIPERYLLFPGGEKSYMILTSLVSNTVDCEHLNGFEYTEPDIDYGRFIYLPESDAERLEFLDKMIKDEESEEDSPNIKRTDKKERIVKIKLPGKAGAADDADLDDVLDVFYKKYPKEAFKFQKSLNYDGNLIITFIRRRPTVCNMCQRKHYNENPYVKVSGMTRDLYFHCRRTVDDKGELFGSLGKVNLKDVNVGDVAPEIKHPGCGPAKDIIEAEMAAHAKLHQMEEMLVKDIPDSNSGDLTTNLDFLRL
jgi:hypothetical protein